MQAQKSNVHHRRPYKHRSYPRSNSSTSKESKLRMFKKRAPNMVDDDFETMEDFFAEVCELHQQQTMRNGTKKSLLRRLFGIGRKTDRACKATTRGATNASVLAVSLSCRASLKVAGALKVPLLASGAVLLGRNKFRQAIETPGAALARKKDLHINLSDPPKSKARATSILLSSLTLHSLLCFLYAYPDRWFCSSCPKQGSLPRLVAADIFRYTVAHHSTYTVSHDTQHSTLNTLSHFRVACSQQHWCPHSRTGVYHNQPPRHF